MRRLAVCLTICCFATVALAQRTPPQAQRKVPSPKPTATPTEPSLAETEEWLKDKILTSAFYKTETDGKVEKLFHTYKVDSITFDGCAVTYKVVFNSWWLTDTRITETTFQHRADLTFFDPQKIAVYPQGDEKTKEYYVSALTLGLEKKVRSHMENRSGAATKIEDEMMNQIGFTFSDEEIANRVAKALIHVVELCGRKKEPF